MGNPLGFPNKNPTIRLSGDLLPRSRGGGPCIPFPGRKNTAPKPSQHGCPSCLAWHGRAGRWQCLSLWCATLARGAAKCPWGCAFLFLRGWCCCVLVSPLFWWKLGASVFLRSALKLPFFSSVVTVGRKSTNWEHKPALLKKLRQKVSYSCMKELHFISSLPWRELSLCLILPLFLVLCSSLLAWRVITVLWSCKSLVSLASS